MIRPHALALLLILAIVGALYLRQREPELRIDAVNAAADCELANPCLYIDCTPRKGPFGGVDPDAGEKDNRRIV